MVKRVALVGAESCGKTTLAEELARKYQTHWVPEYGRFYWEGKKYSSNIPVWQSQEFEHIARVQNELEDYYAQHANQILFCDTTAFAVSIWHYRYLKSYSKNLELLARGRKYDAVFLCDADIPFVQDGVRDGEYIRHDMTQWFADKLQESSITFTKLSGPHQGRLTKACQLIDPWLTTKRN